MFKTDRSELQQAVFRRTVILLLYYTALHCSSASTSVLELLYTRRTLAVYCRERFAASGGGCFILVVWRRATIYLRITRRGHATASRKEIGFESQPWCVEYRKLKRCPGGYVMGMWWV